LRTSVWVCLVGVVGVPPAIAAKCIGLAAGFGIAGALAVLLGTFVGSGDKWHWFRRLLSPRWGAIESGMTTLRGVSLAKNQPRQLEEGDRGYKEILKIIAERRSDVRLAGVLGIQCGAAWAVNSGKGSVPQEFVSLRRPGVVQPDALASSEALEQWVHDARVRSLSHLGFLIVSCGVALGLVSTIMQAIGSGS
jgi:hypothetical protein